MKSFNTATSVVTDHKKKEAISVRECLTMSQSVAERGAARDREENGKDCKCTGSEFASGNHYTHAGPKNL